MSEYKPPIEMESFTLLKLKTGLRQRISKYLLEKEQQPNFEMYVQEMAKEIYVNIYQNFGVMQQEKNIFFTTPKTWWDHFKMKYRGNWLIKRLKPVQWGKHKYEIDKMLVFPDFKIPRSNEFIKNFIIYQINKKELM